MLHGQLVASAILQLPSNKMKLHSLYPCYLRSAEMEHRWHLHRARSCHNWLQIMLSGKTDNYWGLVQLEGQRSKQNLKMRMKKKSFCLFMVCKISFVIAVVNFLITIFNQGENGTMSFFLTNAFCVWTSWTQLTGKKQPERCCYWSTTQACPDSLSLVFCYNWLKSTPHPLLFYTW